MLLQTCIIICIFSMMGISCVYIGMLGYNWWWTLIIKFLSVFVLFFVWDFVINFWPLSSFSLVCLWASKSTTFNSFVKNFVAIKTIKPWLGTWCGVIVMWTYFLYICTPKTSFISFWKLRCLRKDILAI